MIFSIFFLKKLNQFFIFTTSKSNLSGQDTHDTDPDTQHTAATSSQPPRKAKSSVHVSDVDDQLDARRLTSLRFATQSPSGSFHQLIYVSYVCNRINVVLFRRVLAGCACCQRCAVVDLLRQTNVVERVSRH